MGCLLPEESLRSPICIRLPPTRKARLCPCHYKAGETAMIVFTSLIPACPGPGCVNALPSRDAAVAAVAADALAAPDRSGGAQFAVNWREMGQ